MEMIRKLNFCKRKQSSSILHIHFIDADMLQSATAQDVCLILTLEVDWTRALQLHIVQEN